MLQTASAASFLDSEDLALLSRVLDRIGRRHDTAVDMEAQAAKLLRLFQAGLRDEEALIRAMEHREMI